MSDHRVEAGDPSPSMRLGMTLHRARALYDDIDLGAVHDWKKRTGGKAVGHMPIYVPRELIHAAGMLPVGVVGGGDRLEIIRGDAYFQSYICRIPRSTIELALSHRLDVLDGMLFPSICDVIRNLSGMWSMLFPNRYVHYVDVPQNFDLHVGGEYWRRELVVLRDDFARLAGREISDDDLRPARRAKSSRSTTRTEPPSASSTAPAARGRGSIRSPRSISSCAPATSCRRRSTRNCCATTSTSPRAIPSAASRTAAASSWSACSASSRRTASSSRSSAPAASSSTTISFSACAG